MSILNNRNKGFSLGEMLIVMALMLILMAFGMGSFVQYDTQFKNADSTNAAKSIFLAAQNHLTKAKADGSWYAYLADHDVSNFRRYSNQGLGVSDDNTVINDYDTSLGGPFADHDFFFVMHPGGGAETELLDIILPNGSIDGKIREKGQYLIELDLVTGTVYGVFYTDSDKIISAADIVYLCKTKNARLHPEEFRKFRDNKNRSIVIGYYGGNALPVVSASTEKPALSLAINNDATLSAVVTAEIKPSLMINLTVTGQASGKIKTFNIWQNNAVGTASPLPNILTVIDNGDGTKTFTLVIDDVVNANRRFRDIFTGFSPGENLIITVRASGDEYETGIITKSTNSLFDSIEEQTHTAYIGAERHLQNLETLDSTSTRSSGISAASFTNVELICNFDMPNAFTPLHNEGIIDFNGNNHVISGATIVEDDDNNAALFAELVEDSNLTIRNLTMNNVTVNGDNCGAVLSTVGDAKKITLSNVFITGDIRITGSTCGGILGLVDSKGRSSWRVNINNSGIIGNRDSFINGSDYAGGMIGRVGKDHSKDDDVFTIDSSFSSVSVTSEGAAGGLIGELRTNSTISNSFVGGKTTNGTYTGSANVSGNTAGGFIGYSVGVGSGRISINNCYSTASVDGSTAGGFLGRVQKVRLYNAYCTGLVTGSSPKAFVGNATGHPSVDNAYYLAGINTCSDSLAVAKTGSELYDIVSSWNSLDQSTAVGIHTDPALPDEYPFGAVITGIASGTDLPTHYGDWPSVVQEEDDGLTFTANDGTKIRINIPTWEELIEGAGNGVSIAPATVFSYNGEYYITGYNNWYNLDSDPTPSDFSSRMTVIDYGNLAEPVLLTQNDLNASTMSWTVSYGTGYFAYFENLDVGSGLIADGLYVARDYFNYNAWQIPSGSESGPWIKCGDIDTNNDEDHNTYVVLVDNVTSGEIHQP